MQLLNHVSHCSREIWEFRLFFSKFLDKTHKSLGSRCRCSRQADIWPPATLTPLKMNNIRQWLNERHRRRSCVFPLCAHREITFFFPFQINRKSFGTAVTFRRWYYVTQSGHTAVLRAFSTIRASTEERMAPKRPEWLIHHHLYTLIRV